MADYITLLGAEQVQSAASSMSSSASEMRSAAGTISEAMYTQRQFMDDWLTRLAQVLEENHK